MYSVKDSGRANYKLFAIEMHSEVVSRVELEHQIRVACDLGQFTVYYQPIISLETERLVGLEALLRWQHPTRGLLAPADFIDVAVKTGAIVPIGRWVLDTACQRARQWHDRHPSVPFTISVNLSPIQLFQADIVETVRGALDRWRLAPEGLVLELTEEVMIKDADSAVERLEELRALGVHLAIDDFGTGYSSLNYLRHLPVDILKIDKSFVDGLIAGPTESAFGKLIIDFAHTLGLRTVAEGVEQPEQAVALRRLGCHLAQGYLLGPNRCPPRTSMPSSTRRDPTEHGPTLSFPRFARGRSDVGDRGRGARPKRRTSPVASADRRGRCRRRVRRDQGQGTLGPQPTSAAHGSDGAGSRARTLVARRRSHPCVGVRRTLSRGVRVRSVLPGRVDRASRLGGARRRPTEPDTARCRCRRERRRHHPLDAHENRRRSPRARAVAAGSRRQARRDLHTPRARPRDRRRTPPRTNGRVHRVGAKRSGSCEKRCAHRSEQNQYR